MSVLKGNRPVQMNVEIIEDKGRALLSRELGTESADNVQSEESRLALHVDNFTLPDGSPSSSRGCCASYCERSASAGGNCALQREAYALPRKRATLSESRATLSRVGSAKPRGGCTLRKIKFATVKGNSAMAETEFATGEGNSASAEIDLAEAKVGLEMQEVCLKRMYATSRWHPMTMRHSSKGALGALAAAIRIWRKDMLKNYLKFALRNISRNKLFAGVSVFGLGVGLGVYLLALRFVLYEFSFDNIKGRNRVYEVVVRTNMAGRFPVRGIIGAGLSHLGTSAPPKLLRTMRSYFSGAESSASIYPLSIDLPVHGKPDGQAYFWGASPAIFTILDLRLLEAVRSATANPVDAMRYE